MVKPRSKQAAQKPSANTQAIEKLADQLADKPYGEKPVNDKGEAAITPLQEDAEEMERISISLPQSMRYILEDLVRERKRAKEPCRSVSAITREALEDYLKRIGKI